MNCQRFTKTPDATELSGAGAADWPGRWNEAEQHLLCAAPTITLAVVETAAHLDDAGLPLNRYVIEIHLPEALWSARAQLTPDRLPLTWSAIPAGHTSAKLGSDWIASQSSPVLLVPSVIVSEECVVLINPKHPKCRGLTARSLRLFEYNRLFRSAMV